MKYPIRLLTILAFFIQVIGAHAAARVQHVFIISIDGGKPAVIEQSEMPVLKAMVAEGAHTWSAKTIFPSITLPSHTSMLTGVGPDKHKILWNEWIPANGLVKVPTVFAKAKAAGFTTAMFVGKEKFRHLNVPGTVDRFDYDLEEESEVQKLMPGAKSIQTEGTVLARNVAKNAAGYIVKRQPGLCFIHLTDPDNAGHKYGWGSQEQIQSFADVDAALGRILKAVQDAGIADQTVIIVSADHGGHAKTHGLSIPDDMNIPWVVWGKGVKKGFTITAPVSTCDTAATALWLLDVSFAGPIDGKVVESAFE